MILQFGPSSLTKKETTIDETGRKSLVTVVTHLWITYRQLLYFLTLRRGLGGLYGQVLVLQNVETLWSPVQRGHIMNFRKLDVWVILPVMITSTIMVYDSSCSSSILREDEDNTTHYHVGHTFRQTVKELFNLYVDGIWYTDRKGDDC